MHGLGGSGPRDRTVHDLGLFTSKLELQEGRRELQVRLLCDSNVAASVGVFYRVAVRFVQDSERSRAGRLQDHGWATLRYW